MSNIYTCPTHGKVTIWPCVACDATASAKTERRGGRRNNPGGRPPKDNARVPAPMRLLPDTVAFLRESGQTLAEATESIVRKSKAFREWQRKQPPHA